MLDSIASSSQSLQKPGTTLRQTATQSVGRRQLYKIQLNDEAAETFRLPQNALSWREGPERWSALSVRQSLWLEVIVVTNCNGHTIA